MTAQDRQPPEGEHAGRAGVSESETDAMVRAARADYLSVLDKAVDTQAALDRVYSRYGQTPPALAAAEPGEPEGAWDEEQDEDPPEPVWDPDDEIDDQGGMSEINPMADKAARLEAEFYGLGSEAGA